MKVLSIGNSFSEDAHRYLYGIVKAIGEDISTHNLIIGGCSLEKHWRNFAEDRKDYTYMKNGEYMPEKASIAQKLEEGGWDVITLQQVSHGAGMPETFEPYIGELTAALRKACPKAKLYLHQTWEYEYCYPEERFSMYDRSSEKMYRCIQKTADEMARRYDMRQIPCGDAIHAVKKLPEFDSEHGGQSIYRDGYHMHLAYGRYLTACVWARTLLGKSVEGNAFKPSEGEYDERLLPLLQRVADETDAKA